MKGNLTHDNFWNKIFNIGGGEESRVSGYETIQLGFELMGANVKQIYEPRFNIIRNFHGGFLYDGDELENLFHYRQDNLKDYWKKIGKKYWYIKLARIVPKKLIKKFFIESVLKDSEAPAYWYKHDDEARLIAFFGSKEKYERLPSKWEYFPLSDFESHKDISTYQPIDYGFDIDKKDKNAKKD